MTEKQLLSSIPCKKCNNPASVVVPRFNDRTVNLCIKCEKKSGRKYKFKVNKSIKQLAWEERAKENHRKIVEYYG